MMRAVTLKTDLNVERKKTSVFCKSVFLSPFCHFKGREGKENEPCSLFSADENRYLSSCTCAVLCCAVSHPPRVEVADVQSGHRCSVRPSPGDACPHSQPCCSSWGSGSRLPQLPGDTNFPGWGNIFKGAVLLSLFQ